MTEICSTNGLDLSERYYCEVVQPLIRAHFPLMPFAAALIGDGSEVLGYDTAMSQDHDWGPRVMLFLHQSEYSKFRNQVSQTLQNELPETFLGLSTQFMTPNQVAAARTANANTTNGPTHSVEVLTIQKFFRRQINFDVGQKKIEPADWLTFTDQKLATITAGRVFDDEIDLQDQRDRFTYYPHDVWLYLLACQWTRIEQEGHLMGRAGNAGDELGSALIAARLVHDLMRLCFLMNKQYAPYPKWFGTAFSRLKSTTPLLPLLSKVLQAQTWTERQTFLSQSYSLVAEMHNALAITDPVTTVAQQFHDRPFYVISTGEISRAIFSQISDAEVLNIAAKRPIGGVDQFSDNTDLLSDPSWRPLLRNLYE